MKKLNLIALFLAMLLSSLPLNANTCLEFDGVDDYVETTLDVQPSALPITTWECWVKPALLNHSFHQAILTADDGGWDRGIWIAPNSNEVVIGYGITGWNPGVSLTVNEWYHMGCR